MQTAGYATSLGMPPITGPLTVALTNGALVLGTVLLGAQTDRLHVTNVILISTLGATTSIFLMWGFSMSLPMLCVFAMFYGFFAGAFSSTWSGIMRDIKSYDPSADTGIVFGMLAAGRGIGNVASGPIGERLLASGGKGSAEFGYGTAFGTLIAFVGVTSVLGGSSWVGRRAGWM